MMKRRLVNAWNRARWALRWPRMWLRYFRWFYRVGPPLLFALASCGSVTPREVVDLADASAQVVDASTVTDAHMTVEWPKLQRSDAATTPPVDMATAPSCRPWCGTSATAAACLACPAPPADAAASRVCGCGVVSAQLCCCFGPGAVADLPLCP